MARNYAAEEQNLGLGETVTVEFGTVYKVAELSPRGLITTSGQLNVTTLDQVTALIISDFGPRPVDWIISLNGTVQRTIHPDDSVTTP